MSGRRQVSVRAMVSALVVVTAEWRLSRFLFTVIAPNSWLHFNVLQVGTTGPESAAQEKSSRPAWAAPAVKTGAVLLRFRLVWGLARSTAPRAASAAMASTGGGPTTSASVGETADGSGGRGLPSWHQVKDSTGVLYTYLIQSAR